MTIDNTCPPTPTSPSETSLINLDSPLTSSPSSSLPQPGQPNPPKPPSLTPTTSTTSITASLTSTSLTSLPTTTTSLTSTELGATTTPSLSSRMTSPRLAGPLPSSRSNSTNTVTSPGAGGSPTNRDTAGSSRTRIYFPSASTLINEPMSTDETEIQVELADPSSSSVDLPPPPSISSQQDVELDELPAYRSPEPVIDTDDDPDTKRYPSDLPPGLLAVEEEEPKKSVSWTDSGSSSRYGVAGNQIERPQIGRGNTSLKLLDHIHPHRLFQIDPRSVVRDTLSTPARPSSTISNSIEPTSEQVNIKIKQLIESLPGGSEKSHEWFFCPICFDWFHIFFGSGELPQILTMDEWDLVMTSIKNSNLTTRPINDYRDSRKEQMYRLNDLLASRALVNETIPHFHPFPFLIPPSLEARIKRIDVPGQTDAFTHLDPAWAEHAPQIEERVLQPEEPVLWASCSSNDWLVVDHSPLPGQMSGKLVREFTDSKWSNPIPGTDPIHSVVEAWSLVLRGMRGWVKLDNQQFASKIGNSLLSSKLVEQFGFGCKQEDSVLRIGPLLKSDMISDEDVALMDRYMMRAWVEINLYVEWYCDSQESPLSFPTWPAAETLGVGKRDIAMTISYAYDLQVSESTKDIPILLDALEQLAYEPMPNRELLQIKVATERSLKRFTFSDLETAYGILGIGRDYMESLGLSDGSEVPDEWVLRYHKDKMKESSSDMSKRRSLGDALEMVGRARGNELMISLGQTGGAYLSVEEAFNEFNALRGSVSDEMLIMQYESYIGDRPSRQDHYQMCLQIIADAPGEERPVLQAYLQGKDVSQLQGPVRKDIPVGLKNIGNTCYLNSILQFIYTIKPIRQAVVEFDGGVEPGPEVKPDMVAKIRSSRRFVQLLRELFIEMYETEMTAIAPQEELARLAIVPIDLVEKRHDPERQPTLTTIDEIPSYGSPSSTQVATPSPRLSSSSSPLLSNDGHSPPPTSDLNDTALQQTPIATMRRRDGSTVLGKRASQDRESPGDGSDVAMRSPRIQSDLISLDDEGDVDMTLGLNLEKPKIREEEEREERGMGMETAFTPDADLSQLDLSSTTELATITSTSTSDVNPLIPLENSTVSSDPPREEQVPTTYASKAATAPTVPSPPPLPPRRQSQALVAAETFGLQQDAAEILINVLAQLEYALDRPGQEANLIQNLFSCKFRQQIVLDGEEQEPVSSVFVHPIIGVEEEGKDLYECLGEIYLGGAEIEYAGRKGFKMDLIDELPPMLYIQMRRSQYDAAKRSQTKTNTHIPFGKTLVMDRFLVGASQRDKSISLIRDIMRLRARLQDLKASKPLPIVQAFEFANEALRNLRDLGVTEQLLDALKQEGINAHEEIRMISNSIPERRAELDRVWEAEEEGKGKVEYELVSVFMHGGTGTGGHYWTYQSNLPKGDKFYYYSDETVREVPSTEVFKDKSEQGVSPALLCYVRKDRDLIDTLHRITCDIDDGVGNGDGNENGIESV